MDRLLSMRVFQNVVDEGGFAAAARALNMSPPVVTRLVADLEEHLGTRLLQRSTRRQSLTEAGQAYLLRVRAILRDIDEADAVVSSHTTELAGLIRLHAPPALATHVVAPLLGEFRQRHPQITLDIEVSSLAEPPIEDFDITLLGTDDRFDADVVARKVVDSEAILVAASAYLQRHGQPRTPQELARHDLLRLSPTGGRLRPLRLWLPGRQDETQEVAGRPVLTANHTDTLLRAALDGAGIMSVALDMVAPLLSRGELVRVLHPWITGQLAMYAALPSRRFIPQRTRVFLDFLIEHTRDEAHKAMARCTVC